MITVNKQDASTFRVTVEEGGNSKNYTVTADDTTWRDLTGGSVDKEQLVTASFEFLLEREPKESILSSFDLTLINRYFPEYTKTIKKRFQ